MKQGISGIFSKEYQNKLKTRYEAGLHDVWGKDSNMIDWSMKQITYLVPICGGKYIVELTKPAIETEFWFGESDCGQGPSPEENTRNMNFVRLTIEDYFMNRNLRGIDENINRLNEIIAGNSNYKVKHYIHYWSSPEDTPIHGFCFEHPWYGSSVSGESWDLDIEDVKMLLEAYKLQRERFVKRLEAYLKRFGSSKLHISSYWIDR